MLGMLAIHTIGAVVGHASCGPLQDQAVTRSIPKINGSVEARRRLSDEVDAAYEVRMRRFNAEHTFRKPLDLETARKLIDALYTDLGDPCLNYVWQSNVLTHAAGYPLVSGCEPQARQYLKEELLQFWERGGGQRGHGDPGSSYKLAHTMFGFSNDDPAMHAFAIDLQKYAREWARTTGDDARILEVPLGFGDVQPLPARFWGSYVAKAISKYDFTDEQIRTARSIHDELQLRLKTHLSSHAEEIQELTLRWEEALMNRSKNPERFNEISKERTLLREPPDLHDEMVRRLDALATRAQQAQAEDRAKHWQDQTAKRIELARQRRKRK